MISRNVGNFLRSTRAGATAISAIAVTIMTLLAAGLIIDHTWLVEQRDMLKDAAIAASLATTQRLQGLPADMSDADVEATLRPMARRYVGVNLRDNWTMGTLGDEDVAIDLDIDRSAGAVGVQVSSGKFGRTLTGRFVGYSGPKKMVQRSGAEQEEVPVWAVLAIDISRSMTQELDGSTEQTSSSRRIDIVQDAARLFVDTLGPDLAKNIAIGVVPWERSVYLPLAPSHDRDVVMTKIDSLLAFGGATRSSAGLEEGRDQLAQAPVNARKALVLLTDGEDNLMTVSQPCRGRQSEGCLQPRRDQCQAAKDDEIEVFTVTAMSPGQVSGTLGSELTSCATSEGHAFLNQENAESLRDAFGTIAATLRPVRRTF